MTNNVVKSYYEDIKSQLNINPYYLAKKTGKLLNNKKPSMLFGKTQNLMISKFSEQVNNNFKDKKVKMDVNTVKDTNKFKNEVKKLKNNPLREQKIKNCQQ